MLLFLYVLFNDYYFLTILIVLFNFSEDKFTKYIPELKFDKFKLASPLEYKFIEVSCVNLPFIS